MSSYQNQSQDPKQYTARSEAFLNDAGEATNRLLVEIELGQQALPKPLLSGYFTNQLNSVRIVNEVQKSLEEQELESVNEIAAGMADADDETVANSDIQRPQLKIKQSLTREFSIENLKRAADKT